MAKGTGGLKGKLGTMIKKVPWWVWVGGLAVVWMFRAKLYSGSMFPSAGAAAPTVSTEKLEARRLYTTLAKYPNIQAQSWYKNYWPYLTKVMNNPKATDKDYKTAYTYLHQFAAKIGIQ